MKVVFDQSHYRHLKVSGDDRARFLNGMVTSNVNTLEEGSWLRTMLLTHKARILAVFEVQNLGDHILLSCEPGSFPTLAETLEKHIVMDDVELEEADHAMHTVWETPEDVWIARPVLSAPDTASSPEEIVEWRILAGMPLYGVDITSDNFPFESPLVRLVDYEKGCFTGQEPVARVRARGGGGSKRLMGLVCREGDIPVKATVATEERAAGGETTSVSRSKEWGSIALAYVHKSAWEPGSRVQVGPLECAVHELPFARD